MSANRTKKAATNIAFNFAQQILTIVLSFVSRTVFIWGLGPDYLGLTGLFSDVLSLLSLVDLGFGTAMIYSFYKPLAEHDYKRMAALTTFYRKVYFVIALTVSAIGICLIPFLPYIINLDKEIPYLTVYYLITLCNVVASYLCIYKTCILSADQKNYKLARVSMVMSILCTLAQIVSIAVWHSYTLYLVISGVCGLLTNIIASGIASKEYPFINEKIELEKSEKKSIFSNLGSIFVYKISSVAMNATDNILISVLVGTMAVGYYSNYLMLQTKISALYTLLFTSVTASIGNLIVSETAQKKYEIFQCEQSLSFIVCGIAIPCYMLLVNDFIGVWLGDGYLLDTLTVAAVGLNMYLSCVLQPLWSYREATGLYRKTKWIMLICAVLNIALSILGGVTIGLAGIIFASAVSRLLTYIWYEPKLLFKECFDKLPTKYYLGLLLNSLLVVGIVLVGKIFPFFKVVDVWTWLLKAVIIGTFTLIAVLIIYHRTVGFKLLKNKVAGLLSAVVKKDN